MAGAGGVEHAVTDKTGVQRFVPRSPTGNQRDLAPSDGTSLHEQAFATERDDVTMCGRKAVERFCEHIVDVIDELLHGNSRYYCVTRRLSQTAPMINAIEREPGST